MAEVAELMLEAEGLDSPAPTISVNVPFMSLQGLSQNRSRVKMISTSRGFSFGSKLFRPTSAGRIKPFWPRLPTWGGSRRIMQQPLH